MRNISGSSAPDGKWVGYDPATPSAPTIFTPEWGNDVQDDIIGVQTWGGMPQAPGESRNLQKAIQRMLIENRYGVGDYYFSGSPHDHQPFDAAKINDYYPGIPLTVSGGVRHKDIDLDNWPLLVPHLNKLMAGVFDEEVATSQTEFDVSSWSVKGATVTLNFSSTDGQNLLKPLIEDWEVHGKSYDNWRFCKINKDSNTLKAGIYKITNVDGRNLSIDVTGAVPTAGVTSKETGLVSIPLHDIGGNKSRLFMSTGSALMEAKTRQTMFGLRHRNAIIEHTHRAPKSGNGQAFWIDGQGAASGTQRLAINNAGAEHLAKTALTGNVDAALWARAYTRNDGLSAYLHIWGGRYLAT